MKEENIKRIKDQKRENVDTLCAIRREQDKKLYELCISLGGHKFWDWGTRTIQMVIGDRTERVRICSVCRFEEVELIERWMPDEL